MMKTKTPPPYAFLVLVLLVPALAGVASRATAGNLQGAPLMHRYLPQDYDAPPQHWAISTDTAGRLYVGNSAGVLRYDGERWDLTRLSGRDPARKVVAGADGRMYVGSHDSFGWLEPTPGGTLAYRELLTASGLVGDARRIGTIWQVIATADGVYFRSERALHFLDYDHARSTHWPLDVNQRVMYADGEALFARIDGVGFTRFVDGRFVAEPGAAVFAGRRLLGLIPQQGWRLLIGDQGFYRADATGIRPMSGEAGTALHAERPYAVRSLVNGDFVVSTLDKTLLRFSGSAQLRERIHLGQFSAVALGSDLESGVWVATEDELLRMSMPSPWSSIGVREGLQGTVADFEWHDDALWLATSRGIARMRAGNESRIETTALPWVDLEAFALAGTDSGLLIAHQEGLLVLEPGASTPRTLLKSPTESMLELLPSRFHKELLYALGTESLKILRVVDGRWQVARTLPLAGARASGLIEVSAGELWFGDSRGGPQRWTLSVDDSPRPRIDVFGEASGLAADAVAGSRVVVLDGRLHAVSGGRVLRFEAGRFVAAADSALPKVDRVDELEIADTGLGTYAFTRHQIWLRKPGAQWRQQHPGSPLAAGFQRLRLNRDGTVRVATWNGLLQFDQALPDPPAAPLRLQFDRIVAQDSKRREIGIRDVDAGSDSIRAGGRLVFHYSMVSMDSAPSYRWRLAGPGSAGEWSEWGPRDLDVATTVIGPHVLTVEARTASGRTAAPLVYRYRVLPPWYQQWWARFFVLLLLAAAGTLIALEFVRRRTLRYERINRQLEARINERTHELEALNRQLSALATQDALTGVANRRAMEEGLQREWMRGLDQRQPLSVLMIDVDRFKLYNDTHGHLEGDAMLQTIAGNLRALHDPECELLARFGGEEFAMLLPGTSQQVAVQRAESIRAAIQDRVRDVTISIGVAGFVPSTQVEAIELLRRADVALYRAKAAGRNRVEAASHG